MIVVGLLVGVAIGILIESVVPGIGIGLANCYSVGPG